MNRVTLIGRVGKDPEVKTTEVGTKVSKFPFATSETYKKDGNKIENTTWHNIVIWGKLSDVVEKYVHKGDQLCLEGKIQVRTWEKNGETKYINEIVVNNLLMLGSKQESTHDSHRAVTDIENFEQEPGDSLPF